MSPFQMKGIEGKLHYHHRFFSSDERNEKENLVTFFSKQAGWKKSHIIFPSLNKKNEEEKTKTKRIFSNKGNRKLERREKLLFLELMC